MPVIEREPLLKSLKRLEPALSSRDLVPVFQCLCFGEKTVHAHDDVVTIQVPLPEGCPILGAVRGKLLLDWLAAAPGKEVEVDQEAGGVTARSGRAKLSTTVLDPDAFLFQPPGKSDKTVAVAIDKEFTAALARAKISLGTNGDLQNLLGVTVIFGDKGMHLYATDNITATRVELGKVRDDDLAVILPPRFVELFGSVAAGDEPTALRMHPDYVWATFKSGLKLFSRAVGRADPKNFQEIVGGVLKGSAPPQPLPEGLEGALQRAVLAASYSRQPFTEVQADSKKLTLLTRSSAGDVRDSLPYKGDGQVRIEVSPSHVVRMMRQATAMAVNEGNVLFTGDGYVGAVSVVTREDEVEAAEEQEEAA